VDVEYTILFPFKADPRVEGLSFEIEIPFPSPLNERRERFRTIGLEMEGDAPAGKSAIYEPEEERQLHTRLQCMEIEEDVDFDVLLKTGDKEWTQKASVVLTSSVFLHPRLLAQK
jgi:hypothetical protein